MTPVDKDADGLVHEVGVLRLGCFEANPLISRRNPNDALLDENCKRVRRKSASEWKTVKMSRVETFNSQGYNSEAVEGCVQNAERLPIHLGDPIAS